MKILIFGLSGSGKTTLATELNRRFYYPRINGDVVRHHFDDWDFSLEGRLRQANRIKSLSDNVENCLIDFVAPLEEYRQIINPTYSIWMNTVQESKYKDTDLLFEKPTKVNKIITSFDYDIDEIDREINEIKYW